MVKVSEVAPFTGTPVAPYALLREGGAITVRVAVLLVAPVPLCVEEIGPVVLTLAPAVVPVTFKPSVHVLLGGRVTPASETFPEPATAAAAPPHVFANPFGVPTTRPAGKASVNATPVRDAVLAAGFATVKVNEVVELSRILGVPKPLLIVGKATTVNVAEAVLPVPPLAELTVPVVLEKMPAAVPFTFTDSVQLPEVGTVAPESEMLPEAAVAVAVPLQVLANPFGVATTRPAGRESVKATPVSATVFAEGLVMVKVRALLAFKPIDTGLNALLIEGGETIEIDGLEFTLVVRPPPEMVIGILMDWPAAPVTFPVTVIGG